MDFLRRTWAEIDIDKALYNFEKIKKMANGRAVMPVVKADAYGHGANILADLYEKHGAESFAVSNINEAIKLRKHGIKSDILVLGYTPVSYINQIYAFNITQAVYCLEYARELSSAAVENSLTVKIHIKADTGMCRIGFDCRDASLSGLCDIENALSLPNLSAEGIFTHYSSADSENADDIAFSDKQYACFSSTVNSLKARGHEFKYIHCCNSAASALRGDEGNLIRPGIILYGISPSSDIKLPCSLEPIMSVRSSVSMVKVLKPGSSISYGRTYIAKTARKIATVPIGYADGYPRALSNKGKLIVNGKFAPIVGRVCMDQLAIDVTDIEGVEVGTVVTAIGRSGELSITFDDIAEICDTIPYEIMCNVSIRMPRVYICNNKTTDVVYLGGTL